MGECLAEVLQVFPHSAEGWGEEGYPHEVRRRVLFQVRHQKRRREVHPDAVHDPDLVPLFPEGTGNESQAHGGDYHVVVLPAVFRVYEKDPHRTIIASKNPVFHEMDIPFNDNSVWPPQPLHCPQEFGL